jgi:thiol-disulfide isomerase/thioredoxin
MTSKKIAFCIGLAAGIALTLLALNEWGKHMDSTISDLAQVHVLRPLARFENAGDARLPTSSGGLRRPWIPELSSEAHDSWTFSALDGTKVTLGHLKGNVVFLNFWSTSCEPCLAEMPGIDALSKSLKGQRVSLLAVTQDKPQTVRLFLKEHPVGVPVYVAGDSLPPDLRHIGIPVTYILDTNGAIVLRQDGAANWDSTAARAFILNLLTARS